MPSTGLLSFLQKRDIPDDVFGTLCQCPQRAYFHFYKEISEQYLGKEQMCQCPQRAYFHFYLPDNMACLDINNLCQCPQRAYFHFYFIFKEVAYDNLCVSMPSTGLLSFLRRRPGIRWKQTRCQCPQRAYFHFYGSLSEPLILAASESYFCK